MGYELEEVDVNVLALRNDANETAVGCIKKIIFAKTLRVKLKMTMTQYLWSNKDEKANSATKMYVHNW